VSADERIDSRLIAVAFGGVLREARTSRRISQELLAERAGCDRTYPSMLERGVRAPGLSIAIAVAIALGVEPDGLVRTTVERLRRQGVLR
jgi:transcriptional regulator with XRE-family HTH domain